MFSGSGTGSFRCLFFCVQNWASPAPKPTQTCGSGGGTPALLTVIGSQNSDGDDARQTKYPAGAWPWEPASQTKATTVKWLGVPGAGRGHCSVVNQGQGLFGFSPGKRDNTLRSDSRCWARDEDLTSPSTELLFSRSSYQLALRFPNQCFVLFFKVWYLLCNPSLRDMF